MLGAAYDTTDVHSAAERLGRVLETMSTAFFTIDRDWRFTYVNAAAERILGRADLVGQVIWEVYDDLDGTGSDINYRAAMETGEPRQLRAVLRAAGRPLRRAGDAQPGRHQRPLPRHHGAGAGRARAPGGARSDRRRDRPAADPQRRRRPPGRDARGRRAVAHPRRRRAQRLRRRTRRRARVQRRRSRIVQAAHHDAAVGEQLRALVGEPLEVDRFGTRTGVLGDLVEAPGDLERAPRSPCR